MPLALVKVARIVQREGDGLGPPVPVLRKWSRRAGKVRPAPVRDDRRYALPYPYKQTPGFEQFRHKVLTARPASYRAMMDRPFPDPGLRVTEATQRMLPAVHPWGRYTVPYPGRPTWATRPPEHPGFRISPVERPGYVTRLPERPTLSEATGYYTASGEALGLGDPGLAGFKFKKVFKKVVRVTGKVLRVAAPLAAFIPGVGIPLAAALSAGASITGQMLSRHKPLSVFRKPLRLFGEAAIAAGTGAALKGATGWFKVGMQGAKQILSPTGNVSTSEILRESEVPPPMPAIGWGEVAQTVGTVLTASADVASQLLRRQQPAPDPEIMYGAPSPGPGSWARDPGTGEARYYPAAGAEQPYVPGSVGSPGSPAEAGPVGAPGMVQEAGMFGGPMMMPLLIVGGVVALLAATRG